MSRTAKGFFRRLRRETELEKAHRQIVRQKARIKRLRSQLPKRTIEPENFVWLFGSPRSGSTWLSEMLSAPEGRRLWREPFFGVVLAQRRNIANKDYAKESSYLLGDAAQDVWLPSMRRLFLDGVAARYPDSNVLLVIKEPNGSMSAPLIMEALPESRLVFLVRDPRDVIASQLDASRAGSWYGKETYEAAVLDTGEGDLVEQLARQYVINIGGARAAYERHEGLKTFVKYEELRADTVTILSRIHHDLDLAVAEDELKEVLDKYSWENLPAGHKGAGKFRRKGVAGGWREELTAEQVGRIEELTAPLLEEFYPD